MSNHNPLRIVFMGTPDFSVPTLEALIQAGHTIVGVYCQPDKQKGRGKQVQMPPVKVAALEHNLPVYQPVTLRDEQVQAELEALRPDVVVVIAYGKILPPWLIRLPQYGCINVHASVLPNYMHIYCYVDTLHRNEYCSAIWSNNMVVPVSSRTCGDWDTSTISYSSLGEFCMGYGCIYWY